MAAWAAERFLLGLPLSFLVGLRQRLPREAAEVAVVAEGCRFRRRTLLLRG
jgi:hypothetical protein